VGFNLLNRVQSDTDDDQQGCSSEIEGNIESSNQDRGKDTDDRDINSSPEGDPGKHLVDVLGGLLSRSNPWDIAPVLFHILSHIVRIEGDCSIKITEEDDESYIKEIVEEGIRSEAVQDGLPGMFVNRLA
jgi:hypothetical protein